MNEYILKTKTKCVLKDEFNQQIELFEGIKSIIFGKYFNQPVKLVEGIRSIKFGYVFNQPINLLEGIK